MISTTEDGGWTLRGNSTSGRMELRNKEEEETKKRNVTTIKEDYSDRSRRDGRLQCSIRRRERTDKLETPRAEIDLGRWINWIRIEHQLERRGISLTKLSG